MLAGRSCYAERLLHETICLVSVPLWFAIVVIFVTAAAGFRSLAVPSSASTKATASLTLHFAVGQEAA